MTYSRIFLNKPVPDFAIGYDNIFWEKWGKATEIKCLHEDDYLVEHGDCQIELMTTDKSRYSDPEKTILEAMNEINDMELT